MRTKGIGPRGLGASKSPMKMYGAKSPAKQTKSKEGVNSTKPPGYNKTKALNENLREAQTDYRANKNPDTKAALTEAKHMVKEGNYVTGGYVVGKGKPQNRKL